MYLEREERGDEEKKREEEKSRREGRRERREKGRDGGACVLTSQRFRPAPTGLRWRGVWRRSLRAGLVPSPGRYRSRILMHRESHVDSVDLSALKTCDAAGQQQAASGVDGVRPRCGHVPLPCMAYHRGCRPRAHAPGDGAPRPCLSNRRHRRRLERHSLVRRHVLCWSGGKGRHGLVHLGGRPDHYQPPCGAGRRPSGKHRGE